MKMSNLNDIDYSSPEKYKHITAEGMWVTKGSKHYIIDTTHLGFSVDQNFHGVFVPEIPYHMILRYTKERDVIWDCFAGSGTTIDVAKKLNRKVIANDIYPTRNDIIAADTRIYNPGQSVQLIIMHPPYADIIRFGDNRNDLSNFRWEKFLVEFEICVNNAIQFLEEGKFLILVMGEIYVNSEEIPLGFYGMEIIKKKGFKLKGWIVKDYGETKNKNKNYGLNKYRALKGGYWFFAGDNIFVMQKKPIKIVNKRKIYTLV